MHLEDIIRDCKDKEITIKIKNKNFTPEIIVIADGKQYNGKVINNEVVWK